MIVVKDFKRLLRELNQQETAVFSLSGVPINIRVFDQGSKIALAASVYEGGNYIPQSVRKCLNQKPFKPTFIKTFLKVDEEHFQISLHYLGQIDELNSIKFQNVVEEFNGLAEEWRLYLDEHDRNDLIHIHVR